MIVFGVQTVNLGFSVIFPTEVDQVNLTLYNQMHIDQAMELVRAVSGCMTVLTVGLLPTEGEKGPIPAVPPANPTMVQAVDHSSHVEGGIPPRIPQERDISTHMSLALGLQDQETYSRLIRYLQHHEQLDPIPVEAMGNCMFSSIRRAIDIPFEYQNIHLRRQIVMTLANHCNFFMPLLKNSIMATYGHPRMEENEFSLRRTAGELTQQQIDDQECPGPYSFHGYLMALLGDGFWGDEIVLTVVSMMFQCGITVLNTDNFLQTKIQHNTSLKDADIILVHCQGRHYVPVCKYNVYSCFPRVKSAAPMVEFGILIIEICIPTIYLSLQYASRRIVTVPQGQYLASQWSQLASRWIMYYLYICSTPYPFNRRRRVYLHSSESISSGFHRTSPGIQV